MITIYGLVDPREPERIRYVGQTKDPEDRLSGHCSYSGNSPKELWVRSLKVEGIKPKLVVLAEVTLQEACIAERKWISVFPPADLLNRGPVPASRQAYEYPRGYLARARARPKLPIVRHSVTVRPVVLVRPSCVPVCPPSEFLSQDVSDEMLMEFLRVGLGPA